MPRSTALLLVAAALCCCAGADTRVMCVADSSRETQAHAGALRLHSDGRISSTVLTFFEQRAMAEWLNADGIVLAQLSTSTLAQDSGSGYVTTAAALNDGIALITAALAPDGGVFRTLTLVSSDGGQRDVELMHACPNCSSNVYQVNTRVVVEERGLDETIITSFDHAGIQLAQLRDASDSKFHFTPFAIVRLPGPRVYTPELALLSAEPSGPSVSVTTSGVLATVDVEHHSAELVSVVGDELMHQHFTFDGVLTPATRLGTALLVGSTATHTTGTGIAFVDHAADDTGTMTTSNWFALIDATGVKRGPDVRLAGDLTLGPLSSGSLLVAQAQSRFTFFFASAGVVHRQEIHCD